MKRSLFAALLAIALPPAVSADDCSFIPQRLETSAGAAARFEDVAWGGFEMGVLTSAGGTVVFTRYASDQARVGDDIPIATGVRAGTARLVWSGTSYGAFFRDVQGRLKFRALSATGDPLGPEVDLFPNQVFSTDETFDVAWDEDVFFVATSFTPPLSGILLAEVETSGAVRSSHVLNMSLKTPVPIDVVVAPHARFVVFDSYSKGSGAATQIIQAVRGVSPRLRGSSMVATSADGFWDGEHLVLIGRLEPIAETRELTVTKFDRDGLLAEAEKTFLETVDEVLVPGKTIVAGGEVVLPYLSTRSGVTAQLRVLRLTPALETISESRMAESSRFSTADPGEINLAWTGTSLVVGLYRAETNESFLMTFCPLKASITGPALVKTGTNVTYSAVVTGGKAPFDYRWDRDSSVVTSTASTVTERFPRSREYVVRLTVTDELGQEFVASRAVTAVAELPSLTVSIEAVPPKVNLGVPVTFAASVAGGVSPYTYRWQFSDGRQMEGSEVTAAFVSSGTYSVVVTATDAAGQTAAASVSVQVHAARRRPVVRP